MCIHQLLVEGVCFLHVFLLQQVIRQLLGDFLFLESVAEQRVLPQVEFPLEDVFFLLMASPKLEEAVEVLDVLTADALGFLSVLGEELHLVLQFLVHLGLFLHLLEGEVLHGLRHAKHGQAEGIFVRVAEMVGEGNQLEGREVAPFQILLDGCQFGQVHVERIEPVRYLVEERIALELGKRAHVHIGTRHLPFTHFLDLVRHARLVHPFFPFRVLVVGLFGFVEAEFRVVQLFGVLHHFGDDFLAHLLVYLAGLAGDEQLHLDGLQVLLESFLLAKQGQARTYFGIEAQAFFVLGKGDDHAHDGALAHLEILVLVGVEKEVHFLGVKHAEKAHGNGAHHDGDVVGADQYRLEDIACLLAFRLCPERSPPSLVEEFVDGRFVYPRNLLHFRLSALLVVVEEGSRAHVFRVGFQLKLELGISLVWLEGGGADTVVEERAGLQGQHGDVGRVREFISSTEGLSVKLLPVGVGHPLSRILQHVAIRHEGVLNAVVQIPAVGLHADALELCQRFFQSSAIQQADNVFDSFVHGILF